MSRYAAAIVSATGERRYLTHGRAVDSLEAATFYPHPSTAWRAIERYKAQHADEKAAGFEVVDSRTVRVHSGRCAYLG